MALLLERILLLQPLCLWGTLFAFIAQHCQNFEEDQLTDMGYTVPCQHRPGLGPFAECNVTDLKKDLINVKANVRTLCIYYNSDVINSGVFSRFLSLKRLEVWGVHIRRVESGAFRGLPDLASLYLLFHDSNCRDVYLADGAFQSLQHLQELELTGLRLASISNRTFTSFPGLVDLRLKYICSNELSDVFCLLPDKMARLRHLTLEDTGISNIRDHGCAKGSKEWPTRTLSQVTDLSLIGTQAVAIEAGSLKVFQNLSRFDLEIHGGVVNEIWESGIGQVSELILKGHVTQYLQTNFTSICHQLNLLKVKSVVLNYIQVVGLTAEDIEECAIGLENLGIWNSKIQSIDLTFLMNMRNLGTLDMVHARLSTGDFCSGAHPYASNITSLQLAKNELTKITSGQFSCMPELNILDLSFNVISRLDKGAFKGIPYLRFLNLNHNKLCILNSDDFKWLPALQILNIDDNTLSDIEYGVFRKQTKLQELRVGKIDVMYTLPINLYFYGIPPTLQYLDIDATYGTNFVIDKDIGAPNGTFTLHLNAEQLECRNCDNALFRAVRELKVNGTQFTCMSEFMVRFFPNLESFEYITRFDKVTIRYTGINTLRNLRRLKLVNLNFENQQDTATLFHNLAKLQILVLFNCRIAFLTESMFQNLTALRILRLYSATPLLLLDGVFSATSSLTTVVFDKVDFRCDCINGWLLTWAERTTHVQVINLQRQICVWHYSRLNFLSTMQRLCQTDLEYLCYQTTAVSIFFFMAISVGYKFGSWAFLVLFFRLREWVERKVGQRRRNRRGRGLLEEMEENGDEEVEFDAFVSFSSRDEGWVLRELVPRLEQQGEPRLRLCLHNRDFEVGKGIVDNIAESIYKSRRTICVLSRRYLRSDWCSLELRVATHRLLAEQRHRLILIFLEHISPFELSAFHRLTKLLRSRTYLDWPQDEAERVNFWERLRGSIKSGELDCAEES